MVRDVAIILGCAGMTDLYTDLAGQWDSLTIIDPVAAGLRLSAYSVPRIRNVWIIICQTNPTMRGPQA